MKLIYLTVDGKAIVESARVSTRMVEMPDGYHPVTNDSVWQDAKRRRDSVLVVTQGVLGPYGASMTREDTLNVLYEIDVAERAFKPQSVSRMWMRALGRLLRGLMTYGFLLLVWIIIAYALIMSFTGG